ncbi:MAG: sulfite exporter TauE/SafE family protein, partial [Candidatus Nanopelagicales bacterium]
GHVPVDVEEVPDGVRTTWLPWAARVTLVEAAVLLVAGLGAGTINTVVGSGSLITFPVLLAFGYPPVVANMTNNLGVLPGSMSGTVAYRAELRDQWPRALRLVGASVVGGLLGAVLLLRLPAAAFDAIVPTLILLACALVVLQPWLRRRISARRRTPGGRPGPALSAGVFSTGVYGGYFGAAQGVLLIALLDILLDDELNRLNALKNVLATGANGAAAVVFVVHGGVAWDAAALIALGSVVGGQIGARIGRRLPPGIYRGVIVVVGVAAVVKLLVP